MMRVVIGVVIMTFAAVGFADETLRCYGDFKFHRDKDGVKKTIPVKVDGSFDLHLKTKLMDKTVFNEAVWEERLNGKTTNTRFDLTQEGSVLKGVNIKESASTQMEHTLTFDLESQKATYLFEGKAKKKALYLRKEFEGVCK